jgi:hypothetical protein
MNDPPDLWARRSNRCDGPTPCCEVLDRLRGADRSEREGFPEVASELRRTARRFFESHHEQDDEPNERPR